MRKYLMLIRNGLLSNLAYRAHFFYQFIGNGIAILLTFFLWKAIYNSSGSDTLNGMTFNQVFVYLALASSIVVLFRSWLEYQFSRDVITGNIISLLIKPYDLQAWIFFDVLGFMIFNLFVITLPSILVISFLIRPGIVLGVNLIFFAVSVIFGFFLSFCIDFMIALFAFYTESIWGISATKEAVVLFLSGAVIPLAFFPEPLRRIIELLPFRAIYSIPLTFITVPDLPLGFFFRNLGIQLFWIVLLFLLSRLMYSRVIRVLTVNGG